MKEATFRVRSSDQVRRSWRRAAMRYAAKVLRMWGEIEASELLYTIADNILFDVPPSRTASQEWGD